MKSRLAVLLLVLTTLVSACGEDNKVGEGVDLNIKDQVNRERLGAATTTTTTEAAAVTETTAQQSAAVGRATTTTAAPVVTTTTTPPPPTTAKAAPALEISVNGDSAGQSQFDPSQARVFAGTLVKWTNKDTETRSIEADDGSFNSGPIAPGQTYTYKADTPGRFNYHDGTRPYAVGTLEVLSR